MVVVLKDLKNNRLYRWLTDKAPFIMLVLSGLSGLSYHFDFYPEVYFYLSDLVGYSVLSNLVMCRVYTSRKYCNSTRIAVLGLLFMNVTSMLGNFLDIYSPLYDTYIVVIILTMVGYVSYDRDK